MGSQSNVGYHVLAPSSQVKSREGTKKSAIQFTHNALVRRRVTFAHSVDIQYSRTYLAHCTLSARCFRHCSSRHHRPDPRYTLSMYHTETHTLELIWLVLAAPVAVIVFAAAMGIADAVGVEEWEEEMYEDE